MAHSRLEHHERSVLLKQTLIFTGSGVGLIIAFLFLILPAFIRVMALRNLGSKIVIEDTAILPARPFLAEPFSATSSASIDLTGNAQAGFKVILLHNGVAGLETTASENGSFTFSDVSLTDGENVFTAVAENDKEERSNPSSEVHISLVKDAPKLEVTQPADGSEITKRKDNPVTVKGTTDKGNKVYMNDRMLFVANDGSFSGAVQLSEGENTIVVKAVNPAGIESVSELKLSYRP